MMLKFLSEMKLRFGKDLDKELHQRMKGMEDKILSLLKLKCKDNFVSEIFAEIECEINESTKRGNKFCVIQEISVFQLTIGKSFYAFFC